MYTRFKSNETLGITGLIEVKKHCCNFALKNYLLNVFIQDPCFSNECQIKHQQIVNFYLLF